MHNQLIIRCWWILEGHYLKVGWDANRFCIKKAALLQDSFCITFPGAKTIAHIFFALEIRKFLKVSSL